MTGRRQETFDVVVVGGGAAGTAAAIGAARAGARTLLVERYGFLGGAATNAQVLSYCGFFHPSDARERMVGGVGRELLLALRQLGGDIAPVRSKSGNWIVMIDPEAVKFALDGLVAASGARTFLHTTLVDVTRDGDRIASLTLSGHAGLVDVVAAAYVDASGEATLAARAGVPLSQPGGPGAALQPASLPLTLGGVADDAVVDRARLAALVGEYNATATVPMPRADGGVLVRLPGTREFWWMTVDVATDGISPDDLTTAEMTARRNARAFLAVLRRLPGFERAYLAASGPQLGIRESRRPRSRGDVTGAMGRAGTRSPDAIARACWPMEIHEAPGRARFVAIGGEGFFDIPRTAIEARDVANLRLGGRVIGADAEAYGSIRVMGTGFATGQAAGVAAALHAQGGTDDATALRSLLLAQGAIV